MTKIILIIFLGLVLRLISINQSFWLDEATTANVSALGVKEILTIFSPGDFHPPLYYLLTHLWSYVFGFGEIPLRTLSVIFGAGTVYVVYLIGKEMMDKNGGIIASILLATSGLHIYYSQEARMYALSAFLVSLTMLFFVKTFKKGRVGEWVLFSLFLVLSAFADYLPILIIPGLWIFAWSQKLKASWWEKFLASHIILIGAGLLWLPTFLRQLAAGLSVRTHSPFWWQILGKTNFKQLILIPTKFVFGRIDMEVNFWQIAIVGFVFLFFVIVLFKSLREFKKTKLIWFWFLLPIAIAGAISFFVPTLSYFRFLFVLPAFYLLIAGGLATLPKKISGLTIGVLIIFNLITSGIYLFNNKNHREDWRGLVSFIRQESSDNTAVVFVADSQQEAYRYYDKDVKILTSEDLNDGFSELWLMRYVQNVFDPDDSTRSKIEDLGYKKGEEFNFNGVVVWRYKR